MECSLHIEGISHRIQPGLFCKSYSPAACSTSVIVFSGYSGPDALMHLSKKKRKQLCVFFFSVLKINLCLHRGDSYGDFRLVLH